MPQQQIELKQLNPKDLRPATYNPRKIGDAERAALLRGMAEFGMVDPIVARAEDLLVLGGHQRLSVALELGLPSIPVVLVPGLDDDRAAAVNILLNNPRAQGVWDMKALSDVLSELDAHGFDATLTGFDEDELEGILTWTPEPDKAGEEDPDVNLTPPAEPISKRGEVYQLGRHRLMCGDSTVSTAFDKLMAGTQAGMVWTDPPYGVAYQSDLTPADAKRLHRRQDGLQVENDALDADGLKELLQSAFGLAWAHCKPGASWYVAAPAGPLHIVFGTVLNDLGLWRQTIQWVKDVFAFGRSDYHYRHEPIFYGWKEGAAHYFVNDRTQDTVWEISRPKRSPEHPTMKPVELVRRAVENSSQPRDVILDPFGGSGTTLIAAEQTGRTAYLMEIDPRYCDVIRTRYAALVGSSEVAA